MPEVEIRPATRRDTSWIAANMREIDQHEIWCQLPKRSPMQLAYYSLEYSPRVKFNAFIAGEPVCAWGISEPRQGLGELWAFGTNKIYGALRAVTDHIRHEDAKLIFADPQIKRLECRSSVEHAQAHDWIESIGLEKRCLLENYGKGGEDFYLFDVTRKRIGARSYEQFLEDMNHVRIKPPGSRTCRPRAAAE